MKNKARLLLGKLTLIIILLLNVNCEKDEELQSFSEDVETNTESNLRLTEGTFKDLLENKEFKKAFSEYQKIKSELNKTTTFKKSANIYDFTIDSTKVKQVITKNKITYNIPIFREEPSSLFFENLVITTDINGKNVKASLLKYIHNGSLQLNTKT